MKRLEKRIKRELLFGDGYWRVCGVGEDELRRVWPEDKNREDKIRQFADERGFRLIYYRAGLGAIFEEPPPSRKVKVPKMKGKVPRA
jgi:hypothetical protein